MMHQEGDITQDDHQLLDFLAGQMDLLRRIRPTPEELSTVLAAGGGGAAAAAAAAAQEANNDTDPSNNIVHGGTQIIIILKVVGKPVGQDPPFPAPPRPGNCEPRLVGFPAVLDDEQVANHPLVVPILTEDRRLALEELRSLEGIESVTFGIQQQQQQEPIPNHHHPDDDHDDDDDLAAVLDRPGDHHDDDEDHDEIVDGAGEEEEENHHVERDDDHDIMQVAPPRMPPDDSDNDGTHHHHHHLNNNMVLPRFVRLSIQFTDSLGNQGMGMGGNRNLQGQMVSDCTFTWKVPTYYNNRQ